MSKFLEVTIRLFGTPKWAVLKKQRMVAIKRRWPSGRITAHFGYREFFCRDGMPFPIRAIPHLEWYCKNVLEPMRARFGPASISGPYRHYWYNRLVVKGASLSYHVWDRYVDNTVAGSALACDLSFARGAPAEWARYAETLLARHNRGGGIGIYNRSHFTHVDSRRQRARWPGN